MSRRYLIVGYEARDHACAWKLAQSPEVEAVYVHTGNIAMGFSEKVHLVSERSFDELAQFAVEHRIDCTLVGDTSLMQSGLVELFLGKGLPILGATQAGAALEGSKLFAKGFMHRHGIPTARHSVCANPLESYKLLEQARYPLVIKSDLRVASERSAMVAMTREEARSAYAAAFIAQRKPADSSCPSVILEEFLSGRELSYTILMDGKDWVPLAAVRDYKRIRDNDEGPNTGGMGSYSPVPWLTAEIEQRIRQQIVEPTMRGMQAEGLQYRGFLYIGIMVDHDGNPWVLEYNTRMGDTEAETILMLLDDDFSDMVLQASQASVKNLRIAWRRGCAISIAVAPPGYPDTVIETPVHLPFPHSAEVMCFGSILKGSAASGIHSGQGRLACVTGYAANAEECRNRVYETARRLDRDGVFHIRSDIALELISLPAGHTIPAVPEVA